MLCSAVRYSIVRVSVSALADTRTLLVPNDLSEVVKVSVIKEPQRGAYINGY